MPIQATGVRYIKLGQGGRWEQLCFQDGTIRVDFSDVSDQLARAGREEVRQHYISIGRGEGVATNFARQITEFYTLDSSILWITFSAGLMWWCFADREVKLVPGADDTNILEQQGFRLRRTMDGWSSKNINEKPLLKGDLTGTLTKVVANRNTICKVDVPDEYVIRKINDDRSPAVALTGQARRSLLDTIPTLIQGLPPDDFELLVELIFARSGWQRTSHTGGSQKTVDIELVLPTTAENAFVQVKAQATQNDLAEYIEEFTKARAGGVYSRMFFVCHTANLTLPEDKRVTVWLVKDVADQLLRVGLLDWLIEKTPA